MTLSTETSDKMGQVTDCPQVEMTDAPPSTSQNVTNSNAPPLTPGNQNMVGSNAPRHNMTRSSMPSPPKKIPTGYKTLPQRVMNTNTLPTTSRPMIDFNAVPQTWAEFNTRPVIKQNVMGSSTPPSSNQAAVRFDTSPPTTKARVNFKKPPIRPQTPFYPR